MRIRSCLDFACAGILLLGISACANESEATPQISDAEITAEVPELSAVHELMYPLWHDAFPAEDLDSIRQLVPQFEPLLAAVDSVELPGILRHKQEGWDAGKELMLSSFERLEQAIESNDTAAILTHTEAFHLGYEQLARMIRPLVPELESFHQELYKLIHYYGPSNDIVMIHDAYVAMRDKMEQLEEVTLPDRLADHQAEFEAAVAALGESLEVLDDALHDSDDDAIQEAIDEVHSAYGAVAALFEG